LAARRAVVRWAWRLFRREWRQQAMVLVLLTVAVAAAIGFASAAYNTVGVPENATFGSANHRYLVDDPDLRTLPADVDAAAERFGPVDVIGQWTAAVPGSVDSIEYRAQDPEGSFSAPMLALRDGRYPTAPGEAAITDGVAATLQLDIGEALDLDGDRRQVVGVVENPSDLNAEFALTARDVLDAADTVVLLIGGTGAFDEVRAIRDFGGEHFPDADLTTRADVRNTQAAAVVLGVAQVVLVLVALVASAGFVAVAQRRLRQLGLLGAIGATERHLRLVVVANGAVIGATAALVGAVVGTVGWMVAAPRMESAVGYRIDRWNMPWWLVAATMAAVVATSTAAAWWPARSVARVPITQALSGRPPALRPARHSATLAVGLVAVGLLSLLAADRDNALLVSFGTIVTVAGILALSPVAIRALAEVARPFPVAVRLALRDLSRYRARSGVALAAVSLSLGVPVAIVVVASAADASAELGNLAPDQLLVWTRDASQPDGVSPFYTEDPNDEGFAPYLPDLTASELSAMRTEVAGAAEELGVTMIPLEVATDPAVRADPDGRLAVTLARRTDIGYLDVALLYVATPGLLASYGLDHGDIAKGRGILTTAPSGPSDVVTNTSELWLSNTSVAPALVTDAEQINASYTSLPASFVTSDALHQQGWTTATIGWLLRSDTPFTDAQISELRDTAADNGLLVEQRRERASLVALRWGATATGMLLALAVLAMTVGIIRAEAARDVRILTATGATSTIRRTLTASTAGGLAAVGALLGTAGAYLALAAGYVGDTSGLTPIPIGHLAMILLGVPVTATCAGWIVAGREPAALAHQPIE
jgi:putative ABC transport system permease protein